MKPTYYSALHDRIVGGILGTVRYMRTPLDRHTENSCRCAIADAAAEAARLIPRILRGE